MESKNIILRETVFDDCRYFAEWECRPEVTEFFTMDEGRNYEDIVTEFVKYNMDTTRKQFTITLKPGEKPIGRVYLSRINRAEDSLDITRIYIADPENRHKGYGEEVLRMILQYAFIDLHMERVTVDFIRDNDTADRLFRKQRFQKEGTARSGCKKNGRYYDLQLMALLRAEFFENRDM